MLYVEQLIIAVMLVYIIKDAPPPPHPGLTENKGLL